MNLKILAALLIYWGMWVMIFSIGAATLFPTGASISGIKTAYPQYTTSQQCLSHDLTWEPGCTGIFDCPKIRSQADCVLQGCSWQGACFGNSAANQFYNESGASGTEVTTGGIFGSGLTFGRFLSLTFLGIGMPDDTPGWAALIFGLCQSCITLIGVGWFISSIWNG